MELNAKCIVVLLFFFFGFLLPLMVMVVIFCYDKVLHYQESCSCSFQYISIFLYDTSMDSPFILFSGM